MRSKANPSAEEKRRHSSVLIPYSYYECRIPELFAGVPLHWHGELEINYIIEGCGEFICGEEKFRSEEGDIIIIPPKLLHAIYPCEDHIQRYDTIVFSPDLIGAREGDRCAAECIQPIVNGSLNSMIRITKGHKFYSYLKKIAENIFSCAKGNTGLHDLLLKSELLRMLWLLQSSGSIPRGERPNAARSELIRPVIDYIGDNFRENLTVEQLADRAHLSKSYFMSLFKQTAGIGAIEYITQLRIKEACELLSDTEMTIAEAALECGFRNLSNFNRQFKSSMGCTPLDYRRLNRKV